MVKKKAKSLNEYRRELYMDVEVFAKHIGVAAHTYYSALNGQVRLATMRRIANNLGVAPDEIIEFLPGFTPKDATEDSRP